jgi:indole-3-glycerol phosphate synthase
VNLDEWKRQKSEGLRSWAAPEVKHIVPSLKDFAQAVSTRRKELSVVAELARATPEEGPLAQVMDVGRWVQALDDASVAAVAIATDEVACGGSLSDLADAARVTSTPVVARDLILSREQLHHLRLVGADAVLLTAAAGSEPVIRAMIDALRSMRMAAPLEVRSNEELALAAQLGARLLVIPAFDDGHLSLALADSLLPRAPRDATVLVRGPFAHPQQLEPLRGRADGIWVAGPLMRAEKPVEFMTSLVRAAESG